MARVGVDIDEPLFPWYDLAHKACEQAGIANGVTPTSYAPFEDYGCTRQEWLDALDVARKNGMYLRAPIGGAAAALWKLTHAGHSIHLVTARGQFAGGARIKADTARWLYEWNIPHDSLTFAADKSLIRVDYFIDDRMEHLNEVGAANDPIAALFLIDHPTNRGCDDRIAFRVGHIRDAVDWIIKNEAAAA